MCAMGGNPFIPPFGMPSMGKGMFENNNSKNIDDLVKNIDAQIAKLEEEERLEKEKLQKSGKSEPDENDFEKIINQKYEEYKNGEKVKEEDNEIDKTLESFNEKNDRSIDVDDLLKKIDAQIAELEKEEAKEKKEKPEEKNDNKIENDIFSYTPYVESEENNISENSIVDSLNPFTVNETPELVKEDEEKQLNDIESLDIINDLLNKETKEEVTNNFLDEANEINEEIEEEIEKPNINVDVDSIIIDNNITDDEFFDDFFGDDDE